jgi:hypothetical protein
MPAPSTALKMRIVRGEIEIPVTTDWASEMWLRRRVGGEVIPTQIALGPAELVDRSSLWIHGSTKRTDGFAFESGDYLVYLDVTGLREAISAGRTNLAVDPGAPILLRMQGLDSPERTRQYHLIEAAFHRSSNGELALSHYLALASGIGGTWTDWLAVGEACGNLGRHREATEVFRRIMPELTRPAGARGDVLREGGHLRMVAMSFAVEGDIGTAQVLLKIEGRTPDDQITSLIERLRQTAPKAGAMRHK